MEIKNSFLSSMKLFRLLVLVLTISHVTVSLVSCSDNDIPSIPDHTYAYNTYVFGNKGSSRFILKDMKGQIVNIESDASWLNVTLGESTIDGHPVIIINNDNGSSAQAYITVAADNGEKAIVTVNHMKHAVGFNDADDMFVTNWWECDSVALQGISAPQRTPWNTEVVTIPDAIQEQYRPEHGWEMAFCYLNDDTMEGVRFFALYNKWTGQLRVYTYIDNPTGWGNDIAFRTCYGEYNSVNLYPFYNTFQYGIPSCHEMDSTLRRDVQFVSEQPQTFSTWLSPYREDASLNPGWYVFELDMSGYVPEGKNWLDNDQEAKFKFFAETMQNQQITLKGTLIGQLDGTFQNEQVVQTGGTSALYGISNGLSMLSGMATSSISSCSEYALLMKNGGDEGISGYLNPTKYWGGFACSLGSALIGYLAESTDPISYDTIPGKIDLALNATIDLDGYIKSYTANDFKPLGVSVDAINRANGPDGHLGKGVWGLAQDPVVYIDKEVLMSTSQSFYILNRGNGTYSQPGDFQENELRMAWLFDPTSVKLNINRDLFPGEIKDLSITSTCGIYVDQPNGHTDTFRSMLTLPERPSFDMSNGTSEGEIFSLSTDGSMPRLILVAPNDLLDTDENAYETPDNSTFVALPGDSAYHFYGRVIEECGKKIMVDPQVYVPYAKAETTYIFDPKAPDFVVSVNVVFEWEGNTYLYTKCFIPRIEVVDHATMLSFNTSLKDYADKCAAQQPTGTLANDPSVDVYNPGGDKLLTKTFRMLDKIK